MAPLPLDLVHSDRHDVAHLAVQQAPQDSVVDRPVHAVPARVKDLGHGLPTEPLRPGGQEPAVGLRLPALAVGPRQTLHHHAAAGAIDPAWGIHEQHRNLPQRHKLPGPLPQSVVAGPPLAAARAGRSAVGSVADRHPQGQAAGTLVPMSLLVHKRLVMLDAVEDSL